MTVQLRKKTAAAANQTNKHTKLEFKNSFESETNAYFGRCMKQSIEIG